MKEKMMLSFDLELWYEGVSLQKYLPEDKENISDCLVESVLPILELLKRYDAKATFFATGKVLKKYPQLVKQISDEGHEIASHGVTHNLLKRSKPEDFERELKESVNLIKEITGKAPKGFRAPNLSLDQETKWALLTLVKLGFKYDSSLFPFISPLAPNKIYRISLDNPFKEDKNSPLIEISLPCYSIFGFPFPMAGSVYFRFIPFSLLKVLIKRVQKKREVIIYLHPWEICEKTPVIKKIPLFRKITRYYGTKKAIEKLEKLLNAFQFTSIERFLALE